MSASTHSDRQHTNPVLSLLRTAFPLLALLAVVALVSSLIGLDAAPSLERTVTTATVNLVLVVGLYTFVGNSGVLSFGHMSFAAVGGYTAAIFAIPVEDKPRLLPDLTSVLTDVDLPPFLATLAGGVAAMLFAALIALPIMRLSGLQAGLATLALLFIVRVIVNNWDSVTKGTLGISSIPINTTRNEALVWALVSLVLAWLYQESRWGLRLRASRDEVAAARGIGVNVHRERFYAWMLSAFITGIGGALTVQLVGAAIADQFFIQTTFLIITMLVIGGMLSLAGAVIGAIAVSVLQEVLQDIEEGSVLGLFSIPERSGVANSTLATLLLLILIFRPAGLTNGRELSLPRLSRLRPANLTGKARRAATTD